MLSMVAESAAPSARSQVAGLSRDWVMMVVNKAAASPVDQTISYWLPLFIFTFATVIASSFFYQVLVTVVTTQVVNNVRLKLIGGLLKSQPNFVDRREHGAHGSGGFQ